MTAEVSTTTRLIMHLRTSASLTLYPRKTGTKLACYFIVKAVNVTMLKTKRLVSILMESPFYLTLTLKERSSLVRRIAESYPFIVTEDDKETAIGYESSWIGVISPK